MSDLASDVILLAEDERHVRLATRYLKRRGCLRVTAVALSAGRGSGEQRVRTLYSREVANCRSRAARAKTALVVVIDADTNEVQHRERQLAATLREEGQAPRHRSERIVHLIPKRQVETWILCLTGEFVNEEADYHAQRDVDRRIPPAANTLFEWSRPNAPVPEHCLPSLHDAFPELRRLDP
jgi:hypothetical protein